MTPTAITGGGRLRRVMIKCVKTGLPISTGIATGDNTDLISRYLKNSAHCPHCGEDHMWSVSPVDSKCTRMVEIECTTHVL